MLSIFAQAPELCELIAAVEDDYARFLQHPGRRPEGPYAELLPFLAEQAQDWEAAALATSSAGSPTSSVSVPSLGRIGSLPLPCEGTLLTPRACHSKCSGPAAESGMWLRKSHSTATASASKPQRCAQPCCCECACT